MSQIKLLGHIGAVLCIAFSPDGTRIVSGSGDNSVRVWDAFTSGAQLKVLSGHTHTVQSVAFSPDGRRIVSSSFDKSVRVWDALTGAQMVLNGHTGQVLFATFSPDGTPSGKPQFAN